MDDMTLYYWLLYTIVLLTVFALISCVWALVKRRRRKKVLAEKAKPTPYLPPAKCPEHDQPWIWVGTDGSAICAYWITVLAAEVRDGYGCRIGGKK